MMRMATAGRLLGAGIAVAMLAVSTPAAAQQRAWALNFGPEGMGGTGTGNGLVTLNGGTLRIQLTFSGLSGNTTVAHVHCCTPQPFTGTAGVATEVPTFTGFPVGVTAGAFDRSWNVLTDASFWNPAFVTASGGTLAQAAERLLTNMDQGRAYFNIHTSTFPNGEIRAFTQVVPEPSTYALMATGLLAVGGIAHRRRQRTS